MNNGSSQLYVFTPSLGPLAVRGAGDHAVSARTRMDRSCFRGPCSTASPRGRTTATTPRCRPTTRSCGLTDPNNDVFYARTYNWSSTGLATGTTPESTDFTLPLGLPANTYSVSVVANGFASSPMSLTIPTPGDDPAPTIASRRRGHAQPGHRDDDEPVGPGSRPGRGRVDPDLHLGGHARAQRRDQSRRFRPTAPMPPRTTRSPSTTRALIGSRSTVTNLAGLSSTSSVTVIVNQTASSRHRLAGAGRRQSGASQQFSATAQDQFGVTMTIQPSFTWSLASGGGTISSTRASTRPPEHGDAGDRHRHQPGSVSGSTLAYVLSSPWSTQDIGCVTIAGAAGDNGAAPSAWSAPATASAAQRRVPLCLPDVDRRRRHRRPLRQRAGHQQRRRWPA